MGDVTYKTDCSSVRSSNTLPNTTIHHWNSTCGKMSFSLKFMLIPKFLTVQTGYYFREMIAKYYLDLTEFSLLVILLHKILALLLLLSDWRNDYKKRQGTCFNKAWFHVTYWVINHKQLATVLQSTIPSQFMIYSLYLNGSHFSV